MSGELLLHLQIDKADQPIVIGAAILIGVVGIYGHYRETRALLEHWAQEQGLELLDAQRGQSSSSPFFLKTSRSQSVFRIFVKDREGRQRRGWVRCSANRVEARWDEK